MRSTARTLGATVCVAVMIAAAGHVQAGMNSLVLHADNPNSTADALFATGQFTNVDAVYMNAGLPSLAVLQGYDSILAYTNSSPSNPVGLGNILADYVDAGGHLVLATYGYSNPWAISGRVTDSGYTPLTNVGINESVSGNLVPTAFGDPVFDGVDLGTFAYFENSNFAHPGLDAGATLLATDGDGVNMIARNNAGNVIGLNLFPSGDYNDANFFQLVGNSLQPQQVNPIPEPTSLAIFGIGTLGLGVVGIRRRKQQAA